MRVTIQVKNYMCSGKSEINSVWEGLRKGSGESLWKKWVVSWALKDWQLFGYTESKEGKSRQGLNSVFIWETVNTSMWLDVMKGSSGK